MITDKPKPRRRWLQFSLRTLLLGVTVFCVWMGITAKRARDQRLAVGVIEEAGGRIQYQHETSSSDPPGPEWLRRLIGDDYFFSVDVIIFSNLTVNDTSLASTKSFADLKWLSLTGTQITDTELVHLKDSTDLRFLHLNDTQITDTGLEQLRELTSLQRLHLNNTKVTDEAVKKLQLALPKCKITH